MSALVLSQHSVAPLALAGDVQRGGARGAIVHLGDAPGDYSTAPGHLCLWTPVDGQIIVMPHAGAAYEIGGEMLAMIPPGATWRGSWRGAMHTMMLEIGTPLLHEFASAPITHPDHNRVLVTLDPTLRHSILALQHSLTVPQADNDLFAGHIARAVAWHYLRHYCGARLDAPERRKLTTTELSRALELIDARLAGKLSLEELAELLDLSVATFCRRFKRTVGVPPYQYVLRARIERAKTLLAQPDCTLSDVAQSLGFYDQSQFSNAFRRAVGVSPREYRRQRRGN